MRKKLLVGVVSMLSVVGMVSACTPPDSSGGLPKETWSFKGTQVKVIESQDAVYDPVFGLCISLAGCEDEPYLLNIGFRVKMGKRNSAEVTVTNNRTDAPENVAPGATVQVTDAAGGKVTFNGVKPVDLLDLTNTSNKLEIVGTYVWASEEDLVGNGLAANSVASALKDGLNLTLAKADISSIDAQDILDLIVDNLGNALGILVQNIPLLGMGDDVLGGGLYVGIGARGGLGSALNGLLGSVSLPAIDIPTDVPPPITDFGLYTMSKSSTTFTHTWAGRKGGLNPIDGRHEWTMVAQKGS